MANYTKLFNSIVTSTIWTEDDKTRIVWITMLAICDQNGEVQASIPGLARLSGVSVADAEMAIGKLLSPDKHSRTPDNEGRRIVPIDGGWELLNHAKYRRMASLEDRKEATAKRVKRHRARNANVTPCNAPVTLLPDKAEAEAEAEADTKANHKAKKAIIKPTIDDVRVFCAEIGLPESDGDYMFHHWESNGWTKSGKPIKSWQAMIRSWKSAKYLPSQKSNNRFTTQNQPSTHQTRGGYRECQEETPMIPEL
jgi:hypothetical protein